jgi:ATP-dependent Zn protease
MSGGNDERKYTESITNRNGRFWNHSNVIVLAATNRADVLTKH